MSAARILPEIIATHSSAISAACQDFAVRRLDVFGSAAKGTFDPARSDIDMVVSFTSESHVGAADRYFGLNEALAAIFGRDVDLLTERSIVNPYLLRMIESERIQVYPQP